MGWIFDSKYLDSEGNRLAGGFYYDQYNELVYFMGTYDEKGLPVLKNRLQENSPNNLCGRDTEYIKKLKRTSINILIMQIESSRNQADWLEKKILSIGGNHWEHFPPR